MTPPSENEEFKMFTCSYRYKGAKWAVDFPATSFEDARARLSALHFGTVDGILVCDPIPAQVGPVKTGFLIKAAVWIRNFFNSKNH